MWLMVDVSSGLAKKAEPSLARGGNRVSRTASATGGWLKRLVRRLGHHKPPENRTENKITMYASGGNRNKTAKTF